MYQALREVSTFLGFLLVLMMVSASHAFAEAPVVCTKPEAVSSSRTPFSLHGHLVADPQGRVHLIWSSAVTEGRDEILQETDTIYYSVFEEGHWTEPVDVLAANGYAQADSLSITDDGYLFVSWRLREGLRHSVRVSRAPAALAGSARRWETVEPYVGTAQSSDLSVDPQGRLHLVYAVQDPMNNSGHIGYAWSDNRGNDWSQPAIFASVDPALVSNAAVQAYADGRGMVHAVWSRYTRENDWLPQGIWYSQSADGGKTWSQPEEVFYGDRAAYPMLSKGADQAQLYMTWIRGVGFADSKYYRLSADGGLTWGEPQLLFENLEGLSGPMALVVDSADTEYLVMSGNIVGEAKIHYSQRHSDGAWSPPVILSEDLPASEYPEAVIVGGNRLVVAWHDFIENNVYYVLCSLDAPAVPAKPRQTDVPKAELTNALPTSTPTVALVRSTATPAPLTGVPAVGTPGAVDQQTSLFNPVFVGILPVVALVGLVVAWKLRSNR